MRPRDCEVHQNRLYVRKRRVTRDLELSGNVAAESDTCVPINVAYEFPRQRDLLVGRCKGTRRNSRDPSSL